MIEPPLLPTRPPAVPERMLTAPPENDPMTLEPISLTAISPPTMLVVPPLKLPAADEVVIEPKLSPTTPPTRVPLPPLTLPATETFAIVPWFVPASAPTVPLDALIATLVRFKLRTVPAPLRFPMVENRPTDRLEIAELTPRPPLPSKRPAKAPDIEAVSGFVPPASIFLPSAYLPLRLVLTRVRSATLLTSM